MADSPADELHWETSQRASLGEVGRWQSGQCGSDLPHCLDCEVRRSVGQDARKGIQPVSPSCSLDPKWRPRRKFLVLGDLFLTEFHCMLIGQREQDFPL